MVNRGEIGGHLTYFFVFLSILLSKPIFMYTMCFLKMLIVPASAGMTILFFCDLCG